jgi:transcriptional regulator with XRE-family HTH domain
MGEPAASDSATLETAGLSFARCLRQIRQQVVGKQASLSYVVGCTDAAISLWESGDRLPHRENLQRLLTALATCGVTTIELLKLRAAWFREKARRSDLEARHDHSMAQRR